MKNDSPLYIVFAGVNGAGKSTFYKTDIWRDLLPLPNRSITRINPDEILRDFGGRWQSASDQLKAGKIALREIERLFDERASFNQETTLCGATARKNILRANDLGYRIYIFYIGVDSAETSLQRIEHRMNTGGHGIPIETVRRRFNTSMRSFHELVHYSEKAFVFDNTHEFKTLAQWDSGTLAWVGNLKAHGRWLLDGLAIE